MVLVDTTVWIDFLRGHEGGKAKRLRDLLEDGEVVCAPVILQEILQGAASPEKLEVLRRDLSILPMFGGTAATYANAGALYARCRWRGITVRSPHDCLIAQIALEHDLPLLHDDADYERLKTVEQRLRFDAA